MSALLTEINLLPVEDRLELVRQVLDGIPEDEVPLTAAQLADLRIRIAEYEANPDEGQPWEEVLAELEKES